MALNLTADTRLAPGEQERQLLTAFTQGTEVLALLETKENV
jgi:hypothetical protein